MTAVRIEFNLAASGNRPGARIGILAWNRAEWIEAVLGAVACEEALAAAQDRSGFLR